MPEQTQGWSRRVEARCLPAQGAMPSSDVRPIGRVWSSSFGICRFRRERAVSESELSLLGRIGAHASWANTIDRTARTAPARAALEAKFLEAAAGDPVRAAHLRKAHFARLALKSAQARRKARDLTADAGGNDAA